MVDYTHYQFHPERRRLQADSLMPPLKLLKDWSKTSVGYLPRIAAGKLFITFIDGHLEVYDEASGEFLWNFRLPNGYQPGLPNDGDLLISGELLITRLDGEIFVLDIESGKLCDRQLVPYFDLESAILLGRRLIGVYVDEDDDDEPIYCFAYDITQREFLWKQVIQRFPHSLTASASQIFLSDRRGHFTSLSIETGRQLWSISVQEIGRYDDLDGTRRQGDVTGIPCLWEDLVIVPVEGYHILALEQTSGVLRWEQTVEIDDPRNLVCDPDGDLILVDAEVYVSMEASTGRILTQKNIRSALHPYGGPLLTRMDVAGNFLYFSTIHRGILVALNRQSGEIPWSFKCAAAVPIRNAPVVLNHRLYLLDEEHNLYIFVEQ